MLEAAIDTYRRLGGDEALLTVEAHVPGSFELPVTAVRAGGQSNRHDAVICLGCVIRGETSHYDAVAGQTAGGIARVGLETGVPTIFGVITAENLEQAIDRADGKKQPGRQGDAGGH